MMETTMTTSQENKVQCEVCQDKLIVYDESIGTYRDCKCKLKVIRQRYLGNLSSVDLTKIVPQNDQQKKALEVVKANPFRSYMFTGTIRAGKTYFMAGLHNYIQEFYTKKVAWFSDYDLKQMFVQIEMNNFPSDDLVTKVKKGDVKVVFIDDLGKATVSDCYMQGLFHLVDELMKREVKFCTTAIISLEEMAKIYGISITRRIEDLTETIINLDERKK